MVMNTCPCCSNQLLRHARHNGVYWFCPHCHQEMPNLSLEIGLRRQYAQLDQLKRMVNSVDLYELVH